MYLHGFGCVFSMRFTSACLMYSFYKEKILQGCFVMGQFLLTIERYLGIALIVELLILMCRVNIRVDELACMKV